ncbi:hypothetical protein Glove_85g121 [Diversispora epigaea]|uniref:Uncharacterized protein n=1 Tax=Diversispora epigaea TaxID=1348612 RepID=A0A397J6Y5_9GLOM|nr:hypothetical protein Glove_85g121 [Diversispora epigaea]
MNCHNAFSYRCLMMIIKNNMKKEKNYSIKLFNIRNTNAIIFCGSFSQREDGFEIILRNAVHLSISEPNKKWHLMEYNHYLMMKHFQNDFDKWTSGSNTIDKRIQDAQQNADYNQEVIEWILYDGFKK